jgi:hypothetical protein
MKKLSTEDFIDRATNIHGKKYDLSLVEYTGMHILISVICPIHGFFKQKAQAHLLYGCKKCGNERGSLIRTISIDTFISRANIVHANFYTYNNINFRSQHQKITITCPRHGDFLQAANDHLKGSGCFKCAGKRNIAGLLTKEEVIERAIVKHGLCYDYSDTEYTGFNKKIEIICKEHGKFSKRVDLHLKGAGCPKCGRNIKQNLWLNSICIKDREEVLEINNRRFIVDGLDKTKNIIYEFYGDYWHGNPNKYNSEELNVQYNKTFGELYKNTIERKIILENAGFKVIEIWETDWDNQCRAL